MRKPGCYNLPREAKPLLVQDGYVKSAIPTPDGRVIVRLARMVEVPFVNSLDCRHDKRLTDPACAGCEHAK
jgi:hypothetical protein